MPRQVATRISDVEYDKVERLVRAGLYINVSDFVRDAVRSRLAGLATGTRSIDRKQLEREVLSYLRSRGGDVWPDEIAEDLGTSVLEVLEALESLRKEGRAVEVELVEREA